MIRTVETKWTGYGDKLYIEAAGLSTDTKPTEKIVTGSFFLEVDTGKLFSFDEESAEWKPIGG